jgi:hypothetical protein
MSFAANERDFLRLAAQPLDRERRETLDRSLYRELSKPAIKGTVTGLRAQAAEVAEERKAGKASGRPVDSEAEARTSISAGGW